MRMHKLTCPNCNGQLKMEINNKNNQIFCPYCGQSFLLDDEKKEEVVTKNININKTITNRTIDDAKIIREKSKAQERANDDKFMNFFTIISIVFILIFGFITLANNAKTEQKKIESGMISVGSISDFEGEHYEFVVAQFKSMGFENIETIDLNDSNIFNKENTVETVSIGGDSSFTSYDYFSKADQIIISYH